MSKSKSKVVGVPIEVKGGKESPFRCLECGSVAYRHVSGKYWCEECGEYKTEVRDLREPEP